LSSSAPNGSKLANSNRPKGELILQVMLAIKYYHLINLHSSLLFRYINLTKKYSFIIKQQARKIKWGCSPRYVDGGVVIDRDIIIKKKLLSLDWLN
jgi:hypothetical protein